MATRLTLLLLFIMLLYSCGENREREKELTGPHAEIQLFITNSFQMSVRSKGDSLHIYRIPENKSVNDFYSVLLQSDTLLKKALVKLGRKGTDEEIESIRENMKQSTIDETDILQVELYFEEEKFACAFLDSLVYIFNEDVMAQMRNEMHRKIEALDKQLDTVRQKIKEAEEARKNDPYQILNPGIESAAYFEQYLKLSNKQRAMQKLKECLDSDYAGCLEEFEKEEFVEDKFLQRTLGELSRLTRRKNENQCATADSEACKKWEKEIQIHRSNLDTYLGNVLVALEEQIRQFKDIIKKMPETRQELSREIEVNHKMYTYLLEKKTELMISGAGFFYPIRLVDKARWKTR